MPFASPNYVVHGKYGPVPARVIYRLKQTWKPHRSETGRIEIVEKGVTWQKGLLPLSVVGRMSVRQFEEMMWMRKGEVEGKAMVEKVVEGKAVEKGEDGVEKKQRSEQEMGAAVALIALSRAGVVFSESGNGEGSLGKKRKAKGHTVGMGNVESGEKRVEKKRKL